MIKDVIKDGLNLYGVSWCVADWVHYRFTNCLPLTKVKLSDFFFKARVLFCYFLRFFCDIIFLSLKNPILLLKVLITLLQNCEILWVSIENFLILNDLTPLLFQNIVMILKLGHPSLVLVDFNLGIMEPSSCILNLLLNKSKL